MMIGLGINWLPPPQMHDFLDGEMHTVHIPKPEPHNLTQNKEFMRACICLWMLASIYASHLL